MSKMTYADVPIVTKPRQKRNAPKSPPRNQRDCCGLAGVAQLFSGPPVDISDTNPSIFEDASTESSRCTTPPRSCLLGCRNACADSGLTCEQFHAAQYSSFNRESLAVTKLVAEARFVNELPRYVVDLKFITPINRRARGAVIHKGRICTVRHAASWLRRGEVVVRSVTTGACAVFWYHVVFRSTMTDFVVLQIDDVPSFVTAFPFSTALCTERYTGGAFYTPSEKANAVAQDLCSVTILQDPNLGFPRFEPGDSGTPLFDTDGTVVGCLSGETVNDGQFLFATVPANKGWFFFPPHGLKFNYKVPRAVAINELGRREVGSESWYQYLKNTYQLRYGEDWKVHMEPHFAEGGAPEAVYEIRGDDDFASLSQVDDDFDDLLDYEHPRSDAWDYDDAIGGSVSMMLFGHQQKMKRNLMLPVHPNDTADEEAAFDFAVRQAALLKEQPAKFAAAPAAPPTEAKPALPDLSKPMLTKREMADLHVQDQINELDDKINECLAKGAKLLEPVSLNALEMLQYKSSRDVELRLRQKTLKNLQQFLQIRAARERQHDNDERKAAKMQKQLDLYMAEMIRLQKQLEQLKTDEATKSDF